MSKPPFPPSGAYLRSIRESARALRKAANISISHDSIERLLTSDVFRNSFQRVSQVHGLGFPLNFTSHLDELNVLSVLSLLNFGSGYRAPLHAATGRGAWDTMKAFVFALYLGSTDGEDDPLSAKGMRSITVGKVAELLRVDIHVERSHETMPGVTVGELGGPLYELVMLITDIMNETGRLLIEYGYSNLGSFVLKALEEGRRALSAENTEAELEVVLERVVRAFPGFQDMAMVDGQPVYCFKKALFLIHTVTIQFGSLQPAPFPLPDTSQSPVFADNVIPSMLVHFGVIDLKPSRLCTLFPEAGTEVRIRRVLEGAVERQGEDMGEGYAVTKEAAYILRAAAIEACEMMGKAGGERETAVDMWLWAVGKEGGYRALGRVAERQTVFY
ncbi:hypothetical protein AX17_005749 [Amanita inopinata Kibby_2008]|nr:hypothetical protein AX17_005749 [Amanita inopinata Kibby_2008]